MKALLTAAALSLAASMPAAAAVVFQDDFSGYGASSVLEAPDSTFLGNWTSTGGNVDYLASGGDFGYLCPAGTNCVDLAGNSPFPAVFSTSMTFAAGFYNVFFQLTGSNRNTDEIVKITFGSIVRYLNLGSDKVGNQSSFGSDFFGVHVGSGGTVLSFENQDGGNIGAILKTVGVETAAVPLPAAGGLMVLGLGALSALRRRRAAV